MYPLYPIDKLTDTQEKVNSVKLRFKFIFFSRPTDGVNSSLQGLKLDRPSLYFRFFEARWLMT